MKTFTFLRTAVLSFLLIGLSLTDLKAQTGTASPTTITSAGGTVTLTGTAPSNRRFKAPTSWALLSGPLGNTVTIGSTTIAPANSNENTATATATFPANSPAGAYTFRLSFTRSTQNNGSGTFTGTLDVIVNVFIPNLYSTSGSGTIKAYNVDPTTGAVNFGPLDVLTPSGSTAGLALNRPIPVFDPAGSLYYILNTSNNSGVVQIYAANPNGTGNTNVGSIDMNGAGDNTGLGFVRFAMDPQGFGWIIAGDGSSQLRIAKFRGNGTNAISDVNTFSLVNLTVSNGSISEFQNGDLAFTASGVLYALSNTTNGPTYIYTLNSTLNPTTLSKKWTVIPAGGSTFSGSVNGIAFTTSGSIHVSTSTGLYFIDATTANQASGTVSASLITSISGLTDLASASLPIESPLPVTLVSFDGSFRNDVATLKWQTENEVEFDHFVVERSTQGASFRSVGNKNAAGTGAGRSSYEFADNLGNETESAFFYRLKMVDKDGKFTYSKTVMIRKDKKGLKGISLAPNPVVNAQATARVEAEAKGDVVIRVVDMTGKLVLQQKNGVNAGVNSISINNINQLQPGNYILQMVHEGQISSVKFTVAR
jgi:hypothetical protein